MKELTIDCLCRVCLKNSHLHKNIYEGHSLDDLLVYELVNDVCDLGICVDDGLPDFLCVECFRKVIEFKSFKTNAHKVRSTLLLIKERVEYEVIKSEVFVSVDAVEPPATYTEDSRQEADRSDIGSELCEEGALRGESSDGADHGDSVPELCALIKESLDDDMEPLVLEPEYKDIDSTEVHVTLLDTGTNPQYLQSLEHKRPPCESKVTADADSCTWNVPTDVESVSEISKNISLSVEIEASSNDKKNRSEGQWIHQGELRYMAPSLQEDFGNEKESEREEKGTGEGGEGHRSTVPEKKLEEKEESFVCYHCGEVLMSKHCLIQHMKVHGFVNTCDCEICSNEFQTKVNLNCHDITHSCTKSYICAECSKSFRKIYNLKKHLRSHTGSKPHICAECSKSFSRSYNLHVHMRLHSGSKPYECAECSKSFTYRSNLVTHMRKHTDSKPYTCTECSKSFSRIYGLKTHTRSHAGIKPYKCAECSKYFSHMCTLKTHMTLHTGSKPYKCLECSKSFSQNCNLIRHMRTHSGSKAYKCLECSKCFSQSKSLKRHARSHT